MSVMHGRRLGLPIMLAVGLGACARTVPVSPSPAPAPAVGPEAPTPQPAAPPPSPLISPAPAPADSSPAPRLGQVAMAFTGDINLGTATLPNGLPPDSGRSLLRAAQPALSGDVVVGNLEGVLADTGLSEKCLVRRRGRIRERENCYSFRTPTYLASRLRDAGFDYLNLANNHSGDLGDPGRTTTVETLDSLALGHYGPLGSIAFDTLQRGDSTSVVALVGFSTYPFSYDLLDSVRSVQVVDSVRAMADIVIVTFHGGAEGVDAQHVGNEPEFLGKEPRGAVRAWAHAMVDAGADAVVGHGPHVLRGIELYRGRPIAYSLGNFATYRGFSLVGPLGVTAVLHLNFDGQGHFLGGRLVPMVQAPRQGPAPDPSGRAIRLVRQLSADDFGAAAADIADDGTIVAPDLQPTPDSP